MNNKETKQMSKEELIDSIFGEIYGNYKIKEAILLQLVSKKPFNILIVGDPGSGKSMFVDSIKRLYNNFESIKNKDKIEILSNDSFCIIDGLDRIDHEFDLLKFIENKNFLAIADPIYGRFDPYGDIANQIGIAPKIISRFDLVFIIRDIPDKKKDELIFKHVYNNYINPKIKSINSNILKELEKLKNTEVKFNDEVFNEVNKFYINLRNTIDEDENDYIKRVPITARQIPSILKLIENYTKLNHKNIADKKEAENGIGLLMYCLKKIGVNPKTGELDIDRLETGITSTMRDGFRIIKEEIKKIEEEGLDAKLELIIERTKDKELYLEDYSKIIDILKQNGTIFEPRRNIFKLV